MVASSFIQVPFLNLMANIRQRAGGVSIRIGGNTQETASVVNSLPGGVAIIKDKTAVTAQVCLYHLHCLIFFFLIGFPSLQSTTPVIIFTPEIIQMFAHISAFVGVKWYLG